MAWLPVFRRTKRLSENALELQFYLNAETEDNVARGMSRDEAYAAARRKLGNTTAIREEVYRMGSLAFLETSWQDVRYAIRTLRKNVAFTVTAVVTLALAIAGNSAMIAVIRSVLLKPLPYPHPHELVRISVDNTRTDERDGSLLPRRSEEIRRTAHSFSSVATYLKFPEDMSLAGGNGPEALKGARVSANFFAALGTRPLLGRGFLPEEDATGGPDVLILGLELWKRRFAGDPQIIGRSVTLNALPYTIVGVLPPAFHFPFPDTEVWVTRPTEWSMLPPRFWPFVTPLQAFARLRPQTTLKRAQAELDTSQTQYVRAHPGNLDARPGLALHVTSLQTQLVAEVRPTLLILFGAEALVLLIACTNIAGLLLARSVSRSREFALRVAVGAGTARLVRQLLAESLVLAVGGGALGTVLAFWALTGIRQLTALDMPGLPPIQGDAKVLAFTLALSVMTGILCGVVPAWRISRRNLVAHLRESGAGQGEAGRRTRFGVSARGVLVIGQVCLSIILLIGAVLLLRSFLRLRSVDPGFQSAHVLTMQLTLPAAAYDSDPKRIAFFHEIVRRVEELPGIVNATAAISIPTTSGWLGTNVLVEGQPMVDGSQQPTARLQSVTPGYFRTLRIPLLRGRYLTEDDDTSSSRSGVVINESFARRFWPSYPQGLDPVGQHLREGIDHTGELPIVGVVADVHEGDLTAASGPEFFVPIVVHAPQIAYLAVRTADDPLSFVQPVRQAVLKVDRNQPVSKVRTMDDILDSTFGQRRLTMILLSAFAAMAVLLSLVGLYGVVAYSVAQRTQEMGIRRALGAQTSDIVQLVLGQGLALALTGVLCGAGGAFLLTRVLRHLLFEVSATDPLTFALTAVLFVLVALAASFVPAYRAAQVDPVVALRVA